MELVTLVEALIILSNEIGVYNDQVAFIGEICLPAVQELSSLQAVYSNVNILLSHLGLDRPPVEGATGDVPAIDQVDIGV